MDYFEINRDTEAVIYGAGQMGRMYQKKLEKWCNVVAFFDIHPEKAAPSLSVPVYNPFLEEAGSRSRQIVVILCLHSSAIHDGVAGELYAKGYTKILFVPENHRLYDAEAMKLMQKCYSAFWEEDYQSLHHIPDYEILTRIHLRANIIRSTDKYVTTLVSPDLIYIGGEKQPDQRKHRDDPDCPAEYKMAYDAYGEYTNKPLAMFQLYRELFGAFLYGEGEPGDYCRICKQVQNMGTVSDEDFLKDRFRVFSMLEQKFDGGLEGFYHCPVEVEWNPRGYFETIDGNHRAVYLYCKGSNLLPVRMRTEDYLAWLKESEAEKFADRYGDKTFFAPVLNPLFLHLPYQGKIYLQRNLYTVFEFLGIRQYSKLRMIDLGCDNGYFARSFWQLGVSQAVMVEEEEELYDMDMALNRLLTGLSGDVQCHKNRYDFEGRYDVAYIHEEAVSKDLEGILLTLNQKISRMLIWFSPVHLDIGCYVSRYSKFLYHRRLRKCMVDGCFWELTVFGVNSEFDLAERGS